MVFIFLYPHAPGTPAADTITAPAALPTAAPPPPATEQGRQAVRHHDPETVIDLRVEEDGLFVGLWVTTKEQWDHKVTGKPYVCFQTWLNVDGIGARRLAYGATPGEALARGEVNARGYLVGVDVPLAVQIGDPPSDPKVLNELRKGAAAALLTHPTSEAHGLRLIERCIELAGEARAAKLLLAGLIPYQQGYREATEDDALPHRGAAHSYTAQNLLLLAMAEGAVADGISLRAEVARLKGRLSLAQQALAEPAAAVN